MGFLSNSGKKTATVSSPNPNITLSKNNIFIHPDLADLIWFGDGKYQNYHNQPQSSITYPFEGFSVKISMFGPDEPSLLYFELPIRKPLNLASVERPPYYPFYRELSPEQRWMYWQFLSNPYDPKNDIGYVFIFYYGLERHLLYGNFEKAFDIILKLRDVYNNKSFQKYSSSALILSAMLHKRPDCAEKFIASLDKEYEFEIPAQLYILCKFGLNMPITVFDIIHFYKAFGFTNNRYIKNNPELFYVNLYKNLRELTGGLDMIYAGQYFSKSEISNMKNVSIPIFANVSIRDKEILLPDIATPSKFTGAVFMLLNKTHEDTKKELAETRKKNNTNEHHITTQPTIPKYTDEKQPCIQDKSTSRTLNKKISVEDIKQFSFTNYKIDELIYDDGMAIMMISTANRNQVKKDIQTVNTIVKDVYKLTKIPNSLYSEPDELKFNTTKMSGTDKKEYYTFF